MPYHVYTKINNGGVTPQLRIHTRQAPAYKEYDQAYDEHLMGADSKVEWVMIVHVTKRGRTILDRTLNAPETEEG